MKRYYSEFFFINQIVFNELNETLFHPSIIITLICIFSKYNGAS